MTRCTTTIQANDFSEVSALGGNSINIQEKPPDPQFVYKPSMQTRAVKPKMHIYNFALVWAFLRIGSSLVAFIMSPLILSLPVMKRRWALPLPETRLPKSSSERERVTALAQRKSR